MTVPKQRGVVCREHVFEQIPRATTDNHPQRKISPKKATGIKFTGTCIESESGLDRLRDGMRR